MSLSRQDVEKVALLGRLSLSPDEIETMTSQLGQVLEYIKQLDTIDTERRQFVKNHFQKDVADPHLYDIVLNTSRIVPRDCAFLIQQGLKLRQQVAEEAVS